MKVWIAAINSVKFSAKSELSVRFLSRMKFCVLFEYLGLFADSGVVRSANSNSPTAINGWQIRIRRPLEMAIGEFADQAIPESPG